MEKYDVIIVGAGMVGLACAVALAQQDFKVTLVEANALKLNENNLVPQARVSAINTASIELLKKLGIFEKIPTDKIAPLIKMQVWDESGGGQIDFDSAEIGLPRLGYIIANDDMQRAAWSAISMHKNVSFHHETPLKITRESSRIILEFAEHKIAASLLIAADGANSWVRKTMGIEAEIKPYAQSGIVAVIETEKPHENGAYQNFLPTGPLGALPLSDPHHMAIVWSADYDYAHTLLEMEASRFNSLLQVSLGNKLGASALITERQEFPLKAVHAEHYCQERLVLIGDAAHTIHPLAGQGVNLGFKDVDVLTQCIVEAKQKHRDIGAFRVLRAYERARKWDNQSMLVAMRGFKTVFGAKNSLLIQMRSLGLNLVNKCGPVKKLLMRMAG
jgi:2-octaprenylphenol hydroxylase